MNIEESSIKIGISSCLLGERVRFDSGHKNNAYVQGVLRDFFEFIPFCPEVDIGMGIPREPIRLEKVEGQTICWGVKSKGKDFSPELRASADRQSQWISELDGYIFKKDSPSCGMERVKVYNKTMPVRDGIGVYAQRVMESFPHLPTEEEGRLQDSKLRENFIQRVYIYKNWKNMLSEGLSLGSLQKFHAKHKYTFVSHDQNKAKELGAMLAGKGELTLEQLSLEYLNRLTEIMKVIATRQNHVNTLQHIQGYLKRDLIAEDKAELTETIHSYRNGLIPLIVPLTLLRHHFRKYPNEYIEQSYYMNPHPAEMMLLNNI